MKKITLINNLGINRAKGFSLGRIIGYQLLLSKSNYEINFMVEKAA